MTDQLPQRPPSPSAKDRRGPGFRPDEWNPDMAAAKMAEQIVEELGKPTIIKRNFSVWYGICKALDDEQIYNCRLRIALHDKVAENSVNIEGKYFERVWAYLMKPKYVISGIPFGEKEEEKPTLFQRAMEWWRGPSGGGKNGNKS